MKWETVIPYVRTPVNFKDHPLKVIDIKNRRVVNDTQTHFHSPVEDHDELVIDDDDTYYDYDYEPDEDYEEDDFVMSSFDYEEPDDWNCGTTYYEEDNDTREQFSYMDLNSTNWNTYDLNNIIF